VLEIGQHGKEIKNLARNVALAGHHESGFDILPDRHGAEYLPALRT